ncbi:MAG: redoxin domain-containing protein [Balneolaceae bacterium]|nr:redoxin domain-containing protein [Balneolaceae bacterium]
MKVSAGDVAPNFSLQDTSGNKVELYNRIREGNKVLLLFFPLAFSSTCTEELCTARDNMKLYNSLDTDVIGISVDSFFTLNEFRKSQNLNFMLLSDFNRTVSEDYGVLYEDFYGMEGVAKRSAFVVGEDKTVLFAEVLEDASRLPDFDGIQKALKG